MKKKSNITNKPLQQPEFRRPTQEQINKAVADAIKELHDAGLPSVHGDDKGVYRRYPDGRKEYVKMYDEEDKPNV